ncbi:thiamine phosphate synthase [Shigella flexneri]
MRTIQLRIKDKRDDEVRAARDGRHRAGRRDHARLFINDYWRSAIKHRAYGCIWPGGLGTTDLKAIPGRGLRLGVSTHDDMDIDVALAARPSYIALADVFPHPNQTDAFRAAGADAVSRPYRASGTDDPTVAMAARALHARRRAGDRRGQHCRGQRHYSSGGLGGEATAQEPAIAGVGDALPRLYAL